MFKVYKQQQYFIKIKHEIDGKINFYSRCIDCVLKKIETVNENKLNDLLKVYTIYKTMLLYLSKSKKRK